MKKIKILSDKPIKTGRKWEYREVVLDTPGWQVDVVYSFGPNAHSLEGKTTLTLRRPIPGKVPMAYGSPVRTVNEPIKALVKDFGPKMNPRYWVGEQGYSTEAEAKAAAAERKAASAKKPKVEAKVAGAA